MRSGTARRGRRARVTPWMREREERKKERRVRAGAPRSYTSARAEESYLAEARVRAGARAWRNPAARRWDAAQRVLQLQLQLRVPMTSLRKASTTLSRGRATRRRPASPRAHEHAGAVRTIPQLRAAGQNGAEFDGQPLEVRACPQRTSCAGRGGEKRRGRGKRSKEGCAPRVRMRPSSYTYSASLVSLLFDDARKALRGGT
ncbi:hypothetical protein B0H13DRAFT_2105945 [Mycena leptocephala]|nr:hypothetical protein B0H13DRAFT_2105945 [Mycena leptocephala]